MTTIWQNDDGTYESGCGCVYERRGDRFVVVKVSETCRTHRDEETAK